MTAGSSRDPGRRAGATDLLAPVVRAAQGLTGLTVDREFEERFRRYLELLTLWNKTHRLTGVTTAAEIVRGLFVDSLLFLPLIPPGSVRIVDIGAGAGFPGVPMCIAMPRTQVFLVEARRKPVSFLRTLVRELGLQGLRVAEGRAEELAADVVSAFGPADAVVTRGVGGFGRLLPTAVEFLRPGGIFIASGPPPGSQSRERDVAGLVWTTKDYPGLGLRRQFLIGSRPS